MKYKIIAFLLLCTFSAVQAQTDSLSLVKKRNAECIVASTFVPGLGQMLKGHHVEGSLFLLSEVALVGAATFPYLLAQDQLKTIQDPNTAYSSFVSAKKSYNNQRIVSYTLYGAAAALHIVNMARAYTLQDKKIQYAVYPTAIPTQDDYAYGVGLTLKF